MKPRYIKLPMLWTWCREVHRWTGDTRSVLILPVILANTKGFVLPVGMMSVVQGRFHWSARRESVAARSCVVE